MADFKNYKLKLRERLQELTDRLEEIDEDLDKPKDADIEERATEREGDEVLEDLGHAGLAEVRMIKAALERIENGSFGTCTVCGEPISDERLDVLPHTPKCRNCAQQTL